MGPLSADRGNAVDTPFECSEESLLQWGRYQLIAEIPWRWYQPERIRRFNGAAIS